ncbi:MAG: DUF4440 domain-containing protein [Terrimonas sp.]|nr:DUF4440 domain-containing protein [Terrimonas sp.]
MRKNKMILTGLTIFTLLITGLHCTEKKEAANKNGASSPALSESESKTQVWKMEEIYWDYVQKNDTVAYKKLWHDDFIGYPSFGDGVADKSRIAVWIPALHEDKNLQFSYSLHKKAVNAIADVVIVFYDADEIWRDKQNNVVKQVPLKLTHTWKKYGNDWMILGGMAAEKK